MQQLIDALTNHPDPSKRSNEVKSTISEALESIKFFAEFLKSEKIKSNARHLLQEFSNYIQVESYKNGDYICKEGDRGDKFYIILQGIVYVYRRNINSNYDTTISMTEQIFLEQNTKIGSLKEGETFGELALTLNKPRFATIKAITPLVIVCTLSKENYAKMTNYMSRELQLKTTALATLFPKLSQNSLIRLAYLMQIQIFPRNHCIFRQGQMPTGFYILSEGEVRLEQVTKSSSQIFAPIMILTAGSLFGVQNMLRRQAYQNQALCLSQRVTVYKFTCESFEQLGDEYSQKALQAAEKTSRREPKIQNLQIIRKPQLKISLRELNEESQRNHTNPRIIQSQGKPQRKIRKTKSDVQGNQITFRNPFFADLDAENFKQIKKISIEQDKQANLKKYNEQFSVHHYFEPIDLGQLLDPIKKIRDDKCWSFASQRETTANQNSMYIFPASGFNTTRQVTVPSPNHTRHTSHSRRKYC